MGTGIKETFDNFFATIGSTKTAETVCRITLPRELTAMEVATMEDKEGGAADEDLDSEDFDLASSG